VPVYHSRRYDSCPHDKAICNRRMSNVHAKHDGSLGHHTLMFSSHSAWNSTPDFIVHSLQVNSQTSESTIKPLITSRHRKSSRVQAWQSQALHATKKPGATNSVVKLITQYALMKAHARALVYANSSQINCLSPYLNVLWLHTTWQAQIYTLKRLWKFLENRSVAQLEPKPHRVYITVTDTVLATHSAWFGHFHLQCVSGDQSTSNSVDYNLNQHLWTNTCGHRVDLYQSKDYT